MSSDDAKDTFDRPARAGEANGVENGIHTAPSIPESFKNGSNGSAGVQDAQPVEEADVDALYADIRPSDPAQGKPVAPEEDPKRRDNDTQPIEEPRRLRCVTMFCRIA
jgi:hypothetical protein